MSEVGLSVPQRGMIVTRKWERRLVGRECVCVRARVCLCMCVHVWVEANGGHQVSCSVTVHFIPLRQGLSLNPEL